MKLSTTREIVEGEAQMALQIRMSEALEVMRKGIETEFKLSRQHLYDQASTALVTADMITNFASSWPVDNPPATTEVGGFFFGKKSSMGVLIPCLSN